jgi:hypothetical protein
MIETLPLAETLPSPMKAMGTMGAVRSKRNRQRRREAAVLWAGDIECGWVCRDGGIGLFKEPVVIADKAVGAADTDGFCGKLGEGGDGSQTGDDQDCHCGPGSKRTARRAESRGGNWMSARYAPLMGGVLKFVFIRIYWLMWLIAIFAVCRTSHLSS